MGFKHPTEGKLTFGKDLIFYDGSHIFLLYSPTKFFIGLWLPDGKPFGTEMKYLLFETSTEQLIRILKNELDLRDAILSTEKGFVEILTTNLVNDKEEYETIQVGDIPEEFLPLKGLEF